MNSGDFDMLAMERDHWSGKVIVTNMLKAGSAATLLNDGRADAVSFGRAFTANPDLMARIQHGVTLTMPDYAKLYTGEAEGYIAYLAMAR